MCVCVAAGKYWETFVLPDKVAGKKLARQFITIESRGSHVIIMMTFGRKITALEKQKRKRALFTRRLAE